MKIVAYTNAMGTYFSERTAAAFVIMPPMMAIETYYLYATCEIVWIEVRCTSHYEPAIRQMWRSPVRNGPDGAKQILHVSQSAYQTCNLELNRLL